MNKVVILPITDTCGMLSWTGDNEATVYADGVQLARDTTWHSVTQTPIPCGTQLLAFKLEDYGHTPGFLASLDDVWKTGDPGMKCSSNAALVSTNWNISSMLLP